MAYKSLPGLQACPAGLMQQADVGHCNMEFGMLGAERGMYGGCMVHGSIAPRTVDGNQPKGIFWQCGA